MLTTKPSLRMRWLWLLPLPMLAACQTQSSATPPVVVSAPTLTPLPEELASLEPPPSGSYLAELTRSRREWRKQLTDTPTKSAP